MNRGIAYGAIGQYQRALCDFNAVIELDSNNVDGYNNKGLILYHFEEYQKAISNFNKALQLNPNHVMAYLNRGRSYISTNNFFFGGIQDFDTAYRIAPKLAQEYFNSMDTDTIRRIEKIKSQYEIYQKIAPKLAQEYSENLKTDISKQLEKLKSQCDDYRNELIIDSWIEKGTRFGELKEYYKAIDCFNNALEIDSENAIAYNNRGYCFFLLGKIEESLRDYNKAIKIAPQSAQYYMNRAELYFQVKHNKEALEDLLQAARSYLEEGNIEASQQIMNELNKMKNELNII